MCSVRPEGFFNVFLKIIKIKVSLAILERCKVEKRTGVTSVMPENMMGKKRKAFS